MGPLSVRARPSSLKRDCDRRTTSTGETCLVNVYAKSPHQEDVPVSTTSLLNNGL